MWLLNISFVNSMILLWIWVCFLLFLIVLNNVALFPVCFVICNYDFIFTELYVALLCGLVWNWVSAKNVCLCFFQAFREITWSSCVLHRPCFINLWCNLGKPFMFMYFYNFSFSLVIDSLSYRSSDEGKGIYFSVFHYYDCILWDTSCAKSQEHVFFEFSEEQQENGL